MENGEKLQQREWKGSERYLEDGTDRLQRLPGWQGEGEFSGGDD